MNNFLTILQERRKKGRKEGKKEEGGKTSIVV